MPPRLRARSTTCGVELVTLGRRDHELDAATAPPRTRATRPRCCRRRRSAMRRPSSVAEVLAHRQQVGERLARVRGVGEQVHDGDVDHRDHASSVWWSNTRAAMTAHMRGHRARDVFDRSRARRGRPPRRGRRSDGRRASTTAISIEMRVRADGFSNSAATTPAREHGRDRRGIGLPRHRVVEDAAQADGIEVVDFEQLRSSSCSASATIGDGFVDLGVGDEQRRREPQRGRRDRVHDEAAVETVLRDDLGVEAAARARPRSGDRRRAPRRRRRASTSDSTRRVPARAARSGTRSRSMTSSTASAARAASGWPPKVVA